MQMREKVGKLRNTVFFPMICGSGGSKSRLAKATGAEPSGQMRDEKLHAVREAHLQVKMNKTYQVRTTFGSLKKCMPLGRDAHFEVKMHKTHQL